MCRARSLLYGPKRTARRANVASMLSPPRVSPDELRSRGSRTRLGHRILQFPLTRLLLGIVVLVPGSIVQGLPVFGQVLGRPATGAVALATFILGYVGYVRLVERRPVVELSKPGAVREWAAGAALGVTLMLLTLGALAALGALRIGGVNNPAAPFQGFYGLPQALYEELLFRALLFKICEESLGTKIALMVQAVVFGALHLLNPKATVIGAVAISLEAGFLLGGVFILTRRLWAVWGLHFAWNYVQGSIFSGSVSGSGMSRGFFAVDVTGPDWLTGGKFGVEASPIAIVLCLAAAGLILRAAHRRGLFVSFSGRRKPT
jgi:membrane protease YdiL (CAAX protease family)